MLLGPVEAEHPVALGGHQQAGRVEPRLGHPLGQPGRVERALLGVAGERLGVDAQQLRLVLGLGSSRTCSASSAVSSGSGSVTSRRITHSSRVAVKPCLSARARAAGWSPWDHALRAPASGGRRERRTLTAAAGLRRHRQVERLVVEQREPAVGDPEPRPGQPVVLEQQRRLLVERVVPVGGQGGRSYVGQQRLAVGGPGVRGDLVGGHPPVRTSVRCRHLVPMRRCAQASSVCSTGASLRSLVGSTKR